MFKSAPVFYWGMVISFLGSLPPGITNLAGVQIAGEQGISQTLFYISGFMLAELFIVRVSLAGVSWLIERKSLFHIIEWMMAVMLLILSVACFVAANSMHAAIIPERFALPAFFTGIVLSIVNPMHLPFWLGWNTVLLKKRILNGGRNQFAGYMAGIALGTLSGFVVYLIIGQYLVNFIQCSQYRINFMLGAILSVSAFLHIRKMMTVPASLRKEKFFNKR